MIDLALHNIFNLLLEYRYILLFPIAIIEGPIISVIAGFFIQTKVFSIIPAYLILLFGDLVGDLLYYSIGRWGGRTFIRHWGKYIGINIENLENFKQKFHNHSKKILLFGKFSQVGGMPSLISAGLSKMDIPNFLLINAAGSGIKILILLIFGYYFGLAYESIAVYLGSFSQIGAFVMVLLIIGAYAYFLSNKKSEKNNE